MNRNRTIALVAMLTITGACSLAGCDSATDNDPEGDIATRTQAVNLDDPYGGFNTADEAPAFGLASLVSDYGPDGDVTSDDPVDNVTTDARRPRRFLMVTWGNLRADSLINFSTDWSGSLCAENGALGVRRLIRFEARDHLLPRTSRACVEWVSHTQPSFDGLIVGLHSLPCDSLAETTAEPCDRPLSVTFKTGPLEITFTAEELVDLHRVIQVDDAGNAVAFNTVVVMPGECPRGFLAGQWKDVDAERYDGIFRGKWISENGAHMGYLRGVYGENARGDHVFFGKWITESGRFEGLLKGRYGLLPETRERRADGWFEGVWVSRELRAAGGLRGVWGTGDAANDEGGYFRGMWARRCLN